MDAPQNSLQFPDDLQGQAATPPRLNVNVTFLMYVDERVAPRTLRVNCPINSKIQDLVEILSATYGESLRRALTQRNLMAIVNGISKGRNFRNAQLGAAGETDVEIAFMIFADHGG